MIEFVIGSLAASILALTFGIMLIYGYKSWVANNRVVQEHRDATLAMQMLGNKLRGASAGEVDLSLATRIDVSNALSCSVASFYQDGSNLVYNPDLYGGGTPFVVVDAALAPSGFTRSNVTRGLGVTLELLDGAESLSMSGVFHFRN